MLRRDGLLQEASEDDSWGLHALERKSDQDGVSRAGNAIWLVRGRNLLKCSPEQLRRASPREELLEGLTSHHGEEATPWTYSRLASELGGSQYEDISMEVPEDQEWHRAQDADQEEVPPRFRLRTKRAAPAEVIEEVEDLHTGTSQASRETRRRTRQGPLVNEQAHSAWWHEVQPQAWPKQAQYWQEDDAAIAIEVPMPDSKRGTTQALENLACYVTGALKRRANRGFREAVDRSREGGVQTGQSSGGQELLGRTGV